MVVDITDFGNCFEHEHLIFPTMQRMQQSLLSRFFFNIITLLMQTGARSRLTDLNGRNSIFGSSLWPGACSNLLPLSPCIPAPPLFLYPHPFPPLAPVTSLAAPPTPPIPYPHLSFNGRNFIWSHRTIEWDGMESRVSVRMVKGCFIEGKTQANVIDLRIRGKLVRKLIQSRSMIPKDGRMEGWKEGNNILSKNN
ncbi:hypothetical protein V1478_003416, partial [Vespula squamosa]